MHRVTRRAGPVLGLLAGIALACNDTSGPADPFVGSWKVSLDTVAGLLFFSPNPFTLTITRTDTVYHGSFADDTAAVPAVAAQIVLSDSSPHSAFAIRGDSLSVTLGWARDCSVNLAGVVTGRTGTGLISIVGTYCDTLFTIPGPYPTGVWTATRQ